LDLRWGFGTTSKKPVKGVAQTPIGYVFRWREAVFVIAHAIYFYKKGEIECQR
jgi:hypothetical protein